MADQVINRPELVAAVSEKAGIAKKDAEKAVKAVFETISEQLTQGNKVQIVGHGTYEVKDRAERTGRNPQTKEEIIIPAKKAPVFSAGKALKEAVNK